MSDTAPDSERSSVKRVGCGSELEAEVERLRQELAAEILAHGDSDRLRATAEAEIERLRDIVGKVYIQRGKDVNTLRTIIRRAFREANASYG